MTTHVQSPQKMAKSLLRGFPRDQALDILSTIIEYKRDNKLTEIDYWSDVWLEVFTAKEGVQ